MTRPIHDDRDMSTAVHSWLTESDEPTPDRGRQIGRIMGRVDEVHQRRRLWPLNPFGRPARHGAAIGTDVEAAPVQGRATSLVRMSALSAVALAVLVTASLMWVTSRPLPQQIVPAGWVFDPADQALFEGLTTLWAGSETDLARTQEVYAEDAVHRALWLDHEEVVPGSLAIWDRLRSAESVGGTMDAQLIRLDDHFSGAHRYLLVPAPANETSPAGTACVLWAEDGQVARHDCILPLSFESETLPTLVTPDASASAEREALAAALSENLASREREDQESMISPDVAHHVLSGNQIYTLEGVDEYLAVMTGGRITTQINVDLPAPEGALRWANFSTVGSGSLCVFEARDGLITRHDCIVPSSTTVPASLTEIRTPPGT